MLENKQAGDLLLEPCEIKMKGQKYKAECGFLTVPENRNDPQSRLIRLPITRILATGDASEAAIFILDGGPGQTNMNGKPPLQLLDTHDFVNIGYRGVDGDVKLDC